MFASTCSYGHFFLFWYVEFVHEACPHLSGTLCITKYGRRIMSRVKASTIPVHSLYNTNHIHFSGKSVNPYIQQNLLSLIRISTIRNNQCKPLPYLTAFSQFPYLAYFPDLGVWLQTGYGLVNGFIDHLYTPLGATSNYRVIANLYSLQITTAPTKPFSSLLCLHQPLPGKGF
jgi:hypothetical protein